MEQEQTPNQDHIQAGNTLIANLMKHLRDYSTETGHQCHGHVNVRNGTPEGLNVVFSSYPNKDFYCWFIDKLRLILVALVNESDEPKVLLNLPIEEAENFQAEILKIKSAMDTRCAASGEDETNGR